MNGKIENTEMSVKNRIIKILPLFLLGLLLTGCNFGTDSTKIVLTSGFGRDEVFRVAESSCTVPEMMVYLTNIQNHYETIYGERIWDTQIDGVTLQSNVKDTALAKMAQIKAMNLLAKKHQVTLDDAEKKTVEAAAKEYYESLNDTEISKMGITEKTIKNLYEEYAISDKLYNYLIRDINPEISDDEARTITVEHILLKTYTLDQDGNKIDFSKEEMDQTLKQAQLLLRKAQEGANFEDLITEYSQDDTAIYSFGKGEMEPEFETAAFNLGNDEISQIVQTQYGYHIIKCISTFNREETDANKQKIVEERKKEVFSEEYDSFVDGLNRNLNRNLWNEVTFIHDEKVTTSSFFEIYNKYFGK